MPRTVSSCWITLAVAAAGAVSELPAQTPPSVSIGALAPLPGVRMWYTDTGGNGTPVVLMHAATGSSRVWEHQTPVFTAAGYRVIAYDRRGYGRTEVEPGAPSGSGAGDLQALMDYLKIDRFHLVATAAGGFDAIDFALSFPQRLRSLVVANSIGGVTDADYQALGRRIRPPQFDALPPDVRELGPSYRAANPEGTARWLELEHASRAPGPPPPAPARRNQITYAALESMKVPTLMLTGDADLYAPPPVMKLLAARIQGAQFVVIPGSGHSAYWEAPELFNKTVLQFIRKH